MFQNIAPNIPKYNIVYQTDDARDKRKQPQCIHTLMYRAIVAFWLKYHSAWANSWKLFSTLRHVNVSFLPRRRVGSAGKDTMKAHNAPKAQNLHNVGGLKQKPKCAGLMAQGTLALSPSILAIMPKVYGLRDQGRSRRSDPPLSGMSGGKKLPHPFPHTYFS